MLRDYLLSMTLVALLMLAYTALVLLHKKAPETVTRAAASQVEPHEASAAKTP